MCSIDWCAFTWQAFATLATGAAATAGAVIVAFRQIGIAEEQKRIAAAQAKTALMAQREKLFDRRYAVFSEVQSYIQQALSVRANTSFIAPSDAFRDALNKMRFLFPPSAILGIDAIIQDADDLDLLYERRREAPSDTETSAQIRVQRQKLRDGLRTLADLIGHEMKLFDQLEEDKSHE